MARRKVLQPAIARLDSDYSRLATDWTMTNRMISETSGESLHSVRQWRRPFVQNHLSTTGRLPPLAHVKNPVRDSERTLKRTFARLEKKWSHLATDWSIGNPKMASMTGESPDIVRRWRAGYVRKHLDATGELPPLSHVRNPKRVVKYRKLPPLDQTHGEIAKAWNVSTTRICKESGHFQASVTAWKRKRLATWVAEGNEHPVCRCGKPVLHMGSCTTVPKHLRHEAGSKILAGSDPEAVARRYRTDPRSAVSWALTLLPQNERAAFKEALRRKKADRRTRMRENADRRKSADARHAKVISLIHPGNPEGEDAIQEAYLAMLESGLDPDQASKAGLRTAYRMAGIGWKATSLDAPFSQDNGTTRGDLLPDERPGQSASLDEMDRRRMEGAPLPQRRTLPAMEVQLRIASTPHQIQPIEEDGRRNDDMQEHDERGRIMAAVLEARTASGLSIKHACKGLKIRNVELYAILGGRSEPSDHHLAQLADHFGIEHSIVASSRRGANFSGRGDTDGSGTDQRVERPATIQAVDPSVEIEPIEDAIVQPAVAAPSEESTHPTPAADTPSDEAEATLIDSVVAALLSAKDADRRLSQANRELDEARTDRDAHKARADAAEKRMTELEAVMDAIRGAVGANDAAQPTRLAA